MAYEMVMPYHLHMPSYFLETFTEYPCLWDKEPIVHHLKALIVTYVTPQSSWEPFLHSAYLPDVPRWQPVRGMHDL